MKRLGKTASLTSSVLLVIGLTACGSGSEPAAKDPAKESSAPAPAADAAGDFCADSGELMGHFDLLDISIETDWESVAGQFRTGDTELSAASPPTEIADEWATVSSFYGLISDAFDGVDLTDEAEIRTTLTETLGEETEAKALAAQEAVAGIRAYVRSECGGEGASDEGVTELSNACTLLTAADLKRVFAGDVPNGTSRTYGVGYLECIWKGDQAEVSVMMMPIGDFTRAYLDKSTPLPASKISGMGDSQAYKGVVGIGRFSTRGHSVSFTSDEVGGFMSVRQGDSSSRPVEVGDAERLARIVFAQL